MDVHHIAMTFSFRARFHLAPGVRLGGPDEPWVLEDNPNEQVELKPCDKSTPIAEANEFSLRGRGYPDQASATRAATRWSGRIRAVFAANHIPADFGDRAARGFVTEHARTMLADRYGVPVLNDEHGVMVFQTEPTPVLIRIGGALGTVHKSRDRVIACFDAVKSINVESSPASVLAFDLYSAASFERNPDTKLVLYVTAVEALAYREQRPDVATDAIVKMMDMVKEIDVDDDMKRSLTSGLRDLQMESIGQACRRLARSLGKRKYLNDPPERLLARCYTLRSRLVHGAIPRPDVDEVRICGANLDRLVGDLLAGVELRDFIDAYVRS